MPATLVLEPELITLIADPAKHVARAAIALVLLGRRQVRDAVLVQQSVAAEAPLATTDVPAMVDAARAALRQVLADAEQVLRIAAMSSRRPSGRRGAE